MKIRKIHS